MTRSNESRDPLEEGEDKSKSRRTSGNREESMTDSGKDAFGSDRPSRNADPGDDDGEAGSDKSARSAGGKQNSKSSGTTSLGGERKGGAADLPPGGVEGETGTS